MIFVIVLRFKFLNHNLSFHFILWDGPLKSNACVEGLPLPWMNIEI